MMRKKIYLIITLLLSACLVGCSLNTSSDQSKESDEEELESGGRYVEEVVDFPEEILYIYDMKVDQSGTLKMLLENANNELCLYESTDKGSNWAKNEKVSNIADSENQIFMSACLGNDNTVYLSIADCTYDDLIESTDEYLYYQINTESGESSQLNFTMPDPLIEVTGNGYGMGELTVNEKGQIFGLISCGSEADTRSVIAGYDLSSGDMLWAQETQGFSPKAYGEDVFLLNLGESIQKLDGATGDSMAEIEVGLMDNCFDIEPEDDTIFYCTAEGIYSTDYEKALVQQVVDGSQCSIMDSQFFQNLLRIDDSAFLLSALKEGSTEGNTQLYRYVYNEELAAEPEQQLTIYSLKGNDTIRHIISEYYNQNDNVKVNYEVGMSGDGAQTVSDAISTLNTEVVAGNGPDIIILNGLPWESYGEKGILEDASSIVDEISGSENLYNNIFEALQINDSQRVVPLGVRIPVVYGLGDAIEGVEDLDTLITATEQSVDALSIYRGNKALFRYFVSIGWGEVVNAEQQIDKEKLSVLLEKIKKLHTIRQDSAENYNLDGYGEFDADDFVAELGEAYDVFYEDNSLPWDENMYLSAEYLSSLADYGTTLSMGYHINTISNNTFSALLAGINASSDEKDLANDFIKFALSTEQQETLFDNSYLPVNSDAFKSALSNPSQALLNTYGINDWPEEEFDQLEQWMKSLSTTTMEDQIVIDTLMDGGWAYLNDEKSLDTAVNEITQTLYLYFAE
ncbi:MAG: extracellular solute-binding protein [Lachnospiraceae bacterium]